MSDARREVTEARLNQLRDEIVQGLHDQFGFHEYTEVQCELLMDEVNRGFRDLWDESAAEGEEEKT